MLRSYLEGPRNAPLVLGRTSPGSVELDDAIAHSPDASR